MISSRNRVLVWIAIAGAALSWAPPGRAQFGPPRPEPITSPDGSERPLRDRVDFEQRLGAQVPLDLELRDETGGAVTLAEVGEGRPILLVPAYYECPMLCSMVLDGVMSSLDVLELDAGRDFEVAVVSFDPGETPETAAAAKARHLDRYDHPGAEEGFHFLTGEEAAVSAVMDAIGFRYAYVPERDEWAHGAGIVILTPDGTVTRYHYGVEYPPRDVRLGLVEAGDGTVGSAVDEVLLYCLRYDPSSGRYSLAILNLVRAGGVLTVAGILFFMLLSRRKARRHAVPGEG